MLTLGNPDIDWVAIARGYGVPATRACTLDELAQCFGRALAQPGPSLVEVVVA